MKTCLLLLTSLSAYADVITFASVGTAADQNQWNTRGSNIVIRPSSAWAQAQPGSSWISYGITGEGPGYFSGAGSVGYTQRFWLDEAMDGTVGVMADDSALVMFNGSVLMREDSRINTYAVCSDWPISCHEPTYISLAAVAGWNQLDFWVSQRGEATGLNYIVQFGPVQPPNEVPEPATAVLLGTAIIIAAAALLWARGNKDERERWKTPIREELLAGRTN